MPVTSLFVLFLAWTSSLFAETPHIRPQIVHEQVLPAAALETLQKEAPLQDLAWEKETALWLLSKSTLWRWNMQKQSLQKIHLGTKAGTLQSLLIFGDSYFIATSHALFIVHTAPFQVKKVKIQKTSVATFLPYPDVAFLLTQEAVYQIRVNPDQIQLLHKIPFSMENPVYDPDTQSLFYTQGNQVYRFDFASNKKQALQGFPSMGSIHSLQWQNQKIIVQIDQIFYHLTPRGEILQTIPVFGEKKVVAQQTTTTEHMFLFTDHILEKITLAPIRQSYYQIPLVREGQISRLAAHDHWIALLQDGMPRIFQTPKPQ